MQLLNTIQERYISNEPLCSRSTSSLSAPTQPSTERPVTNELGRETGSVYFRDWVTGRRATEAWRWVLISLFQV